MNETDEQYFEQLRNTEHHHQIAVAWIEADLDGHILRSTTKEEDFKRWLEVATDTTFRVLWSQPDDLWRFDPDVLDKFRATGEGWQSRISETLRRATP